MTAAAPSTALKTTVTAAIRHSGVPLRVGELARKVERPVGEVDRAVRDLAQLGLVRETDRGWAWGDTPRLPRPRPSRAEVTEQTQADVDAAYAEIDANPGQRAAVYQTAAHLPAWRWKRASRELREHKRVVTEGEASHTRYWPADRYDELRSAEVRAQVAEQWGEAASVRPDPEPSLPAARDGDEYFPCPDDPAPPASRDASSPGRSDGWRARVAEDLERRELDELRGLRGFLVRVCDQAGVPDVPGWTLRERLTFLAGAAQVAR